GAVLDCDGTLTPKELGSLFSVVDKQALPPEAKPDFEVLRERYIPLANVGKLSPELQLEWLAETFEIYIRWGLTRAGWMTAIARSLVFRPGAVETLGALHAAGVPTAIVSYGSADFIEHALTLAGADGWVSGIYATRMRHDGGGRVTGYDRATFVTQENKGEWSRVFAEKHGIALENLLAVGDTAGDRYLGHLKEKRFGLAKDEEERAKIAPYMGETAVSEDFAPARVWLSRHLGLPL
ncbi:MAG TPA: haloacid dehalogenase-like hydrolase, partial [Candidatus Baltobacteraceae bacterium]|nr:haloacid dehalogenase-like hydrolase [Candidatus Baltobacteraceae bacterium]